MSHTVLVTTPRLAPAGADILAAAGCRILYVGAVDPEGDLDRLMAAEAIDGIVSRSLRLTARHIDAAPKLRAISRHGIGFDNVDIEAAAARNIPVCVAPGTNAQSVAELALGLMLSLARAIPSADAQVRNGAWPRGAPSMQLSGRVLGLVGYGRIARALGAMAAGIGMDVVAYDPMAAPGPARRADSLPGLLAEADIVSLHCPLTQETGGLIGAEALAAMKRGAFLINTARGGLVDEAALSQALQTGRLGGAGLDAMSLEPPSPDNPLLSRRDVILTPHVGGNTDAALQETARLAAANLVALLNGEPVPESFIVNRHLIAERVA